MPREIFIGLIISNKDRFLILNNMRGNWVFIKTPAEENKSPEQVMRDESEKLLNIKTLIFIKGFEEKQEYFYKKEKQTIHKEVSYMIAETNENEIELSEYQAYEWLEYEKALQKLTFKADKDILKTAYEHMKYNK